MPASEIDDIFSGKVSKVAVFNGASAKGKGKSNLESTSSAKKSKKSKKSKKRKRRNGDDAARTVAAESIAASSSSSMTMKKVKSKPDAVGGDVSDEEKVKSKPKRQRLVETVRDPSAGMGLSSAPSAPQKASSKSKRAAPDVKSSFPTNAKAKKGAEPEELQRFTDSRGSGPRKKTEEGFLVYKEDELGIRDEGGDTPLCPFDCDCCF